jgi:hypothetical protein
LGAGPLAHWFGRKHIPETCRAVDTWRRVFDHRIWFSELGMTSSSLFFF